MKTSHIQYAPLISLASGNILGDTTSYFLGYYGRLLLPESGRWIQEKIQNIASSHPRLLPIIFFGYGAFVPLSNDLLTIPFGMARYPFFRLMIPLLLGNVAYGTIVAYFGEQIFSVLSGLLS